MHKESRPFVVKFPSPLSSNISPSVCSGSSKEVGFGVNSTSLENRNVYLALERGASHRR